MHSINKHSMDHTAVLVLSDGTIVEAGQQARKLILHVHHGHTHCADHQQWPYGATHCSPGTCWAWDLPGTAPGIPGYPTDALASQQQPKLHMLHPHKVALPCLSAKPATPHVVGMPNDLSPNLNINTPPCGHMTVQYTMKAFPTGVRQIKALPYTAPILHTCHSELSACVPGQQVHDAASVKSG